MVNYEEWSAQNGSKPIQFRSFYVIIMFMPSEYSA